jgi:putative peptide zinc metalloprotease protein
MAAEPAAATVWDSVRESLSLANYRPILRQELTWARLKNRRGSPYAMLAERPRKYWRLTPQDDFIASRMDGTRRVSDLVIEYFHRFGRFGFDRIAKLVSDLRNAGFLMDPPRDVYKQLTSGLHPETRPKKPSRWEGNALRLRLPLRGIDPLVTRMHDRFGWVFFKPPVLALTVVVTVVGLAAFISLLRSGHDPFAPIGNSGLAGLVALVVAYYAVVFVHESAHAITCKHFGRQVPQGGFMLYYFVPAFYVDVTDAWLEPWYRRILIFWAGPYSGFMLAGTASIIVWLLPGGLVGTILFKLAVAAYINNAFNLMPLLLLDGYWILEEWLSTPGLRQRALDFIRGPLWHRVLDRKRLTRQEAFFTVFGALSAVYSFLSIYVAFLYWGRRVKPIVRPLWETPGFLARALVVVIIAFVAIPLGIRFGGQLWKYQKVLRRAPEAARKALTTIRIRDRLRLLRDLGFLSSLPLPSLERLARAARVREVSAGSAVIRQGERGDEFYIVGEGEAEIMVREGGEDTVVERISVGGFFGERALLGTGIRQATVRAVGPMKLLVFGQKTFWSELGGTVAWETQVRGALEERERLGALALFAEAAPRQLDLLAVKLQVRGFQAGETLVRQGEPGDAFYIVRAGSVEVVARQEGRSRRLSILGPGEFFGEVALLRNQPRTATVRGKTDGSVWRLERDDFRDLLGRYLQLEGQIGRIADARVPRGHSVVEPAA